MSRDERTSISSGSSEPPTPPSNHIIKKECVNVYKRLQENPEERGSAETITIPLSFRVKDSLYIKYKKFNKEKRRIVKEVLERAIEALSGIEVPEGVNQITINMPISIAKSESRVGVDEHSKEYIEALKERIKELQEVARIYREKAERLEKTLNAVRQALSYGDVNTARKVLGLR